MNTFDPVTQPRRRRRSRSKLSLIRRLSRLRCFRSGAEKRQKPSRQVSATAPSSGWMATHRTDSRKAVGYLDCRRGPAEICDGKSVAAEVDGQDLDHAVWVAA